MSNEELLVKHCTHVESFLSYILPFFSFIDFNGDVKPPSKLKVKDTLEDTDGDISGKSTRFHSPLHLFFNLFLRSSSSNNSGSSIVLKLTSNMGNLGLDPMQLESPRDDSPPTSFPDHNANPSAKTPSKPDVGNQGESLLTRVWTGTKQKLFGTPSEDSPGKTDSTKDEEKHLASRRVQFHEEEDSTTSSDKFDVFCPDCERYATCVENGGYGQHDWLCSDPNCRNFRKHMSTSNIDAGAGRFFIASSGESVASSDQEFSSSVSANQQRKRDEDESITSSDQFVCAECKSYERGELQSWDCYDPNCQNNGQTWI